MWDRTFWLAATERAVKTLAQTMLALWVVGDQILDVFKVDWVSSIGVGLGALLVSFLTSVVSVGVGPSHSPSLVAERYGRHAA